MPRVTVVMPCFDQAWILPFALASLAEQTYQDFEVVVVDDASPDDSVEVAEGTLPALFPEGRWHVVQRADNSGSAAAPVNDGIRWAAGRDSELWTWVSSDNLMSPAFLATLVSVLDDDAKRVGAAYGGFTRVAAKRRQVEEHLGDFADSATLDQWWRETFPTSFHFTPHFPDWLISNPSCYYGPAFLIRRDVWERAGDHPAGGRRTAHDLAHWLQVEEACWELGYEVEGVDQDLCVYLAHDERALHRPGAVHDPDHFLLEARKRRAGKMDTLPYA